MEKEYITTEDGSMTIRIPQWNVTYHSIHGAIQESIHVFIEAGLYSAGHPEWPEPYRIFEMGLGTGLNAFLTTIEAEKQQRKIQYTAVERLPISVEEALALNYTEHLHHKELFQKIHKCKWGEDVTISEYFTIRKEKTSLSDFFTPQSFHVIYYDAFAPKAQPELWTQEIFEHLFRMLHPHGILVTYCSKGDVRRAMMAAGFAVQKLPGPRGKREMLRAMAPFRLPTTGEATNPQT